MGHICKGVLFTLAMSRCSSSSFFFFIQRLYLPVTVSRQMLFTKNNNKEKNRNRGPVMFDDLVLASVRAKGQSGGMT